MIYKFNLRYRTGNIFLSFYKPKVDTKIVKDTRDVQRLLYDYCIRENGSKEK
jgi:hypothetical protein